MKKLLLFIIPLALIITAVCSCFVLYRMQNPLMMQWKDTVKIAYCNWQLPVLKQEREGLSDVAEQTLEGKKLLRSKEGQRLIDEANGFSADFSTDAVFDFSRSSFITEITEGDLTIKISREYATQKDSRAYCMWYFDRFMTDSVHLEQNKLELVQPPTDRPDGGYWFSVEGEEGYSYAFVPTNTRIFYRILFRYPKNFDSRVERMEQLLDSFRFFRPNGKPQYTRSHQLKIPTQWSEEAKEVFQSICTTDSIYWGIFADKMLTEGTNNIIPELEQRLDYQFPVVLYYLPFGDDFPINFMQQHYNQGKLVELTYQMSSYSNEKLFGETTQLAVYRGLEDETIRTLARGAKAFGHPFLFRLNNEMNSDWTNYSGVVVMEDPDIYVEVWRRIYRIFQEEGVDNAIWIFNPNDRDYPPANWNHFMTYYPGDEYVQLIGITGYNTGTYYQETKNETWREFKDIYDRIESRMMPYFAEFPWMITEFSSSSIGGNKAKWIEKMFTKIEQYPNIKLAVWFHYADYDPDHKGVVARPYWLDETSQTLEAAKKGLKQRPKWPFEQ